MLLSLRVELQPNTYQTQRFLQEAGATRWVYNWGLSRKKTVIDLRKEAKEKGEPLPKVPTKYDLDKELNLLKKVRKDEGGCAWLASLSSRTPKAALDDLDKANKAFFDRGCRGFPRFKSRNKDKPSFRMVASIRVDDKHIFIPKLSKVRIKPGQHWQIPPGVYKSVSVTQEPDGRWYASVHIERSEAPANLGPTVGLDLGVVTLAVASDGAVFHNPARTDKALKREKKRKRLQRGVSRKEKGSANRRKAQLKLNKHNRKTINQKKDYVHKTTTSIAKTYGTVVLEDLNVKSMMKKGNGKRGLNRVIAAASFSEFRRLLEYKAKVYGSRVVLVPAAYSSQRCSRCGYTDKNNRKSQEVFECCECGFAENADLNAAKNLVWSHQKRLNACGEDVRHGKSLDGSQMLSTTKQESESICTSGSVLE